MRLFAIALATLVASAGPALAHPEGHEMEKRQQARPIAEVAQESVVKLVAQAKLPASWSKAKPIKSEMRMKGIAQQWVVTFENKAERTRARQRLYVLMTPGGQFISANHKLT